MSQSRDYPKKIFLFSGKRKSGKDYVTERLAQELDSDQVAVIRISGPVKTEYGKEHGLEIDELFSSSKYKERYRAEMVAWSQAVRRQDPGRFCRASLDMYEAHTKPFWIVTDVRRKTDIRWFNDNFPGKIVTLRIVSSDGTRAARGWTFTEGIDDEETECDLDDVDAWDRIIDNDGMDLTSTLTDLAVELLG